MNRYLDTIRNEWLSIISMTRADILEYAKKLVEDNAVNIAANFYSVLLTDPQSEDFLSNEQVENRLKSSLARWITSVMACRTENIDQVISVQQHVGEVHARIGIPLQLVEMGARVLKKYLFSLLDISGYTDEEKFRISVFIVSSIDISTEIMSRSFSFSDSYSSKEDENYRIFSLIENADEEKERQIASLLEWEMDVIYKVMLDSEVRNMLSLSRSDFGLWFNHKGRHYFSGFEEVGNILKLMQEVDEHIASALQDRKRLSKRPERVEFLFGIRNNLSQIGILLRTLFDDVSRHEVGVDVLTKLLNRRFLPTIFKREIAHANRTGAPLSVLVIDVDHFKEINDKYGHSAGDEALRKVSLTLYDHVRSSDYVFRYGGDEFVIILSEASEAETRLMAERIRNRVQKQPVGIDGGGTVSVTITIGAAMFNGHPDYEQLIHHADEALYQAKALGRNRFIMYRPA